LGSATDRHYATAHPKKRPCRDPTDLAYTIVLVVGHEDAGQRTLSTPGVRERITEALRAQKTQLLRTAYLTARRTDAKVVNYFARRLIESKGGMPGLPLATSRGK
jgi:hypothetical protein